MIVVDTSALVVYLLRKPDADAISMALASEDRVVIGAPTLFELRLVMLKRIGVESIARIDALLARMSIEVLPFEAAHSALAFEALSRFGKAPAKLNYGDCMCYAVAKALDARLLFKGLDFAATDLSAVALDA